MREDDKERDTGQLTIAAAQVSPVWLDRAATLEKVARYVTRAANQGCDLVAFGEALVPGYPFWIERTEGARFDDPLQKEMFALYAQQAVQPESGHLQPICEIARQRQIAVILGCIERAHDRGGHSLYCSAIYIDASGQIRNVHRKLVPTHEERLAWSPGDGHGLKVQPLGGFTVGTLNCWENWMPLSRTALYAQGEDLHIALWPGSLRLTHEITRFIALESRSYVLSVSAIMRADDIPDDLPCSEMMRRVARGWLADGGSCLAGPDGNWIVQPVVEQETLLVATIDQQQVRRERLNLDPAGHYSRPDVTQLKVNRARLSLLIDDQN